jgi:hypothetical protein
MKAYRRYNDGEVKIVLYIRNNELTILEYTPKIESNGIRTMLLTYDESFLEDLENKEWYEEIDFDFNDLKEDEMKRTISKIFNQK